MRKLKLSYFGHIMRRQGSSEKTIMLGRVNSSRKNGKPDMRWLDFTKEAIGMPPQEPSRATGDRHWGHHSFIGSPGLRADSMAHISHNLLIVWEKSFTFVICSPIK